MSIKKTLYLITMTLILCIMTLGYAALQERIDVEVEANIDSTYRVEITRVAEGTVVGDARSVQAPNYHDLTSTFNVGLTNDTDYITYTVEVTNYSTVDIRLNNLDLNTTNNNMKVVKIGITNGDIILAGSTKTFTVKIKLETETSSEQTSTITIIADFTRLKGGVGSVVEEVYDEYEIGDIISFAGSNWYVIENSPSSSDYVTLIKQTVLTNTELTSNYAYNSTNTMAYYWSNTCHIEGTYGTDTYDSREPSGCKISYSESKIKEFLEDIYINTLGLQNLKEIKGYKIRLITKDELSTKLGWISINEYATAEGNDVPNWIYHVGDYWIMMGTSSYGELIANNGRIGSILVNRAYLIRPVINLYKSAID